MLSPGLAYVKPFAARRRRSARRAAFTGLPIRRCPIVIVHSTLPLAIGAAGFVEPGFADRRPLQLLVREIELVGVEIFVVAQDAPWQRPVFLANAEKAAKGHDRIGDPAATFVDHDALDCADPVAIAAPHRRAFHFVAGDQTRGFAHHDVGSNSGHYNLLALTDSWNKPRNRCSGSSLASLAQGKVITSEINLQV